jgi:hypothetical protein
VREWAHDVWQSWSEYHADVASLISANVRTD